MVVIEVPQKLQIACQSVRMHRQRIGFVPTMGALHEGHLSLIRAARKECDVVIASIFVNPTQFNNSDDFAKYPNTLSQDLTKLETEGVDIAFTPVSDAMYSDGKKYYVSETTHGEELCGLTRPGHFNGVLTVVMKLLNLTNADKVYMGEKDYQQLHLVREMTKAFFMTAEIVACPTVRDEEGLALSSRNTRLSTAGLQLARLFAKTLKTEQPLSAIREALTKNNIRIDYLEEKYGRRFAAVFIDDVRLIDNVAL